VGGWSTAVDLADEAKKITGRSSRGGIYAAAAATIADTQRFSIRQISDLPRPKERCAIADRSPPENSAAASWSPFY